MPFLFFGLLLWWGSTRNYLLFHAFAELWAVVIACLMGFLGLTAQREARSPLAAGLGILYLAVAVIDVLHTLAFKGMGVFPGVSPNFSTQFWILARSLEAGGLLGTILFHRKDRFLPAFAAAVALASATGLAAVFTGNFPDCYLPDTGLTPFKIAAEWAIAAVLLLSSALVHRSNDPAIRPYKAALIASLLLTAASEMAFTLYTDVYGVMNMTGHLFKVASFYVLLVGVIIKSLKDPLQTLYFPLLQAQEALLQALTGPSFILDANGTLVAGNLPAASPGATLKDLLPCEAAEQAEEWIERVETGGSALHEILIAGERKLSVFVQPLKQRDGTFAGTAFLSLDLTEEEFLRNNFKESQRRYKRLFSRMQEGLAVHELCFDDSGSPVDYRFLEVNPAFARQTGLRVRNLVGRTAREVLPGLEPLWLERYGNVVRTGKTETFTGFSRDLGRWFEATAYPMGGNRFAVCVTDRTAEMEARRLLEEKESLYRALVEEMPALVCRFDENGVLSFVNQAYCRFFAKTPEELLGRSFLDFLPEDARQKAKEQFLSLSRDNPSVTYEHAVSLPDGRMGWQRWTDRALFDGTGRRIGFQSVGFDLTERNQAIQALKIKTAELEQLFHRSPLGIFFCDLGGRVLRANESALKMFGYTRAEAAGKTIEELLVPEEDREISLGHWKALFEEKRPFLLEARRRRKDGSFLQVRAIGFPILIGARAVGAYLIYQDVTAQKEAKEALERANRKLEERFGDLRLAWEQTIRVLMRASEARDPYTAGHQKRVAQLVRAIAEELGLEPEICTRAELAALVHDIGKIEVPSEILVKPGTLNPLEMRLIQIHSEAGWRILKEIDLSWPLAEIVHQHHERTDGSGYPRGLKGEDILLEARIIAVADTVEAMASHRPYRPARGIEEALKEIERGRGSRFDPAVTDACLRLFRERGFRLQEN